MAMRGREVLFLMHCVLILCFLQTTTCSPPADPIKCESGSVSCTIQPADGLFPDRSTCHASRAVYPASEQELLAVVANATMAKIKMKAATRYSHSIPKFTCPGGDKGLLISTKAMDRVVSIDKASMTMTVESGMLLRGLLDEAAKAGMALPCAPYWVGVTVGGMITTGSHGSSLWGKGGAAHEYVAGLRIVTPASAAEGYARVRSLNEGDPELDAAKVSLGVLGVISQVTFKLQPLFKRSITYSEQNDSNLADNVVIFGRQHEFADMEWYPAQKKTSYRIDDRVPLSTPGDGFYDNTDYHSVVSKTALSDRLKDTFYEKIYSPDGRCALARMVYNRVAVKLKYGLTNDGTNFTGFPVIGFQNRMQSSGSCLDSPQDGLRTACPPDPRIFGTAIIQQSTISISISKIRDFILEVQKLRDMVPKALCGLDAYGPILLRYVKASSAYLGKQEDSVDVDMTYSRSDDPMTPRMFEDVLEEMEQMALFKYGGIPHWGKNRNLAYDGVIKKFAKGQEFLKVRAAYDPLGLFSSEWSDQVLGIKGRTSIYRDGCALEGLCVCSKDAHCAPRKGYYCRPGKVYTAARVCIRLT